jgi:hypothetical protein
MIAEVNVFSLAGPAILFIGIKLSARQLIYSWLWSTLVVVNYLSTLLNMARCARLFGFLVLMDYYGHFTVFLPFLL